MIQPIYGYHQVVSEFVERQVFPDGGKFETCKAIGFAKDGILIAGFVYHNWNPASATIEVSGASITRKWATKDVIRVIFGYPFDQVGCQAVCARHSEYNTSVRRIWRALGAQEYVIPRLRGRDEAEAIAVLTVEAWRGSKFGRNEHG